MEGVFGFISITLLNSAVRMSTPIILAALAAALCNRAGVLNLAIDGKMLAGSFVALLTTYLVRTYAPFGDAHPLLCTYIGIGAAMMAGALLGIAFAWLHTRFAVDLVVLAIAINMLSSELTVYLMRALFGKAGTWAPENIVKIPDLKIPLLSEIPVLGPLLSGYNAIVYFSWFAAIFLSLLMFRTRLGRHIRAVGENQDAAAAVGIDVPRVQRMALAVGGALSGLAGAFLSVGHLALFTRDMSGGRGWTGNAAALFGFNNPGASFAAGLFFGFADAVALRLQSVTKLPSTLIQVMPNLATLIILSVVSYRALKKAQKHTLY